MVRDFDDNEFPLAYLISFRCYGTWLHGDRRGSVDRKHNVYGTPKLSRDCEREGAEFTSLKHKPVRMDATWRPIVEKAIREVCDSRHYVLKALNARTNHVHSVVSAALKPEPILIAFKAYATRALRKRGLVSRNVKPWSRHGSTIYLWKEKDVAAAINYVLFGQGDDLFRIED
ncbi:MAG TPA: transposase [Pyrinomonadaceae bacterium]|nr:transposase [Pyrinomonadaceae bacterium]